MGKRVEGFPRWGGNRETATGRGRGKLPHTTPNKGTVGRYGEAAQGDEAMREFLDTIMKMICLI